MKKVITEVYHYGRLVDGKHDKYVKFYLHPIVNAPIPGYRWVGFQIGATVYGWTEREV
jgi:hypothetical protein